MFAHLNVPAWKYHSVAIISSCWDVVQPEAAGPLQKGIQSHYFSPHTNWTGKSKHDLYKNFILLPPPYFLQSKWEASLFLQSPRISRYYQSFKLKSVILSLSTISIKCCHFHFLYFRSRWFQSQFLSFSFNFLQSLAILLKEVFLFSAFPTSFIGSRSGWTF